MKDQYIMQTPVVLSIAGSDSSGGAGIQADLKTCAALEVYGCSVITAITAQNTQGVQAIDTINAKMVIAQCKSIFADVTVSAIKIGVLGNEQIIHALADYFESLEKLPIIILDPVMVSTSGAKLLEKNAVDALKERLIPKATLLTPNLTEAAALLNASIPQSTEAMHGLLTDLLDLGSSAVLLKGGHLTSKQSTDLYCNGKEVHALSAPFVMTNNTHGTGCSLSSAIAAYHAKGLQMKEAILQAKTYVHACIKSADQLEIGKGSGPIHHFVHWWQDEKL